MNLSFLWIFQCALIVMQPVLDFCPTEAHVHKDQWANVAFYRESLLLKKWYGTYKSLKVAICKDTIEITILLHKYTVGS